MGRIGLGGLVVSPSFVVTVLTALADVLPKVKCGKHNCPEYQHSTITIAVFCDFFIVNQTWCLLRPPQNHRSSHFTHARALCIGSPQAKEHIADSLWYQRNHAGLCFHRNPIKLAVVRVRKCDTEAHAIRNTALAPWALGFRRQPPPSLWDASFQLPRRGVRTPLPPQG